MFKRISPFILVLLIFAGIGFVLKLIQDPISILVVVGLSFLLFFLVNNYFNTGKFFTRVRKSSTTKTKQQASRSQPKKSASPKKPNPFQVIEGSKGKSKTNKKDEEKIYH
ncbi:hypothetical protein ACQCN2_16415 [Brevibacillus ginsengisoli]|uniref:hypothetical protein n=1 Tax=Brevibacillus ginsengisoli TaxID=363854 RepID=UPI003CF779AF